MTTKADYDRAHLEGMTARRAGKPRHKNDYAHRRGPDGELLRERWEQGWDLEDEQHAH